MFRTFRFLLGLLLFSLIVGIVTFRIFEPQHKTLADILWWWVVTSTTVGYGDVVPVTAPGRIAATVVILVGIYAYTYIISLILQKVRERLEARERGLVRLKHKNHVVICVYSAYADELIQEIKASNLFPDRKIVIVTNLVERTPYREFDFVYGVPISPEILKRANIAEADTIFVFANERFAAPDKKTLHVVSRIMRYNRHAPIYVELNNPYEPMLGSLPRSIIAMASNDLQAAALSHRYIDVQRYLKETNGAAD